VAGISDVTMTVWRRDKAFVAKIKNAVAMRLYKRLQRIESGEDGWPGCGWILERLHPTRFAKPEIQLSFNNNTLTQNFLSISISGPEAKAIEVQAAPIREKVQAMIEQYRPALGNGEGKVHDEEATPAPKPDQQMAGMPAITHKAGDEKRQSLWRLLVGGNPEKSIVAKATATFVCRTILAEVLGYRAAGVKVEFSDDPVRLCDLLGAIDKLCEGPGGWQLMRRKAGYV
jgi:hypothetical protein